MLIVFRKKIVSLSVVDNIHTERFSDNELMSGFTPYSERRGMENE